MKKLTVGRIGFANCTPLFMALEEGGPLEGISLVNGVPTELNARLDEGTLDVSPSSSVAYLRNPAELGFLPDLSISSIGEVRSVLLFSRVHLGRLGGENIELTPSSATSVVLLRVLLETFAGVEPTYGEGFPSAAKLLIGDAALAEAKKGGWEYCYDLGKLWLDATDTPFVFALWLVRRESLAGNPETVRAFYRKLVAARQLAYRNYPRYAKTAPEATWMGEEGLLEYWGTISYDLTAWHLKGLARFAREAHALGLISAVPDLKALEVE